MNIRLELACYIGGLQLIIQIFYLPLRNLNTIRAIGREHGDPVDRPKLMARYAQSCLYRNENRCVGLVKWLFRRARFEYCLM